MELLAFDWRDVADLSWVHAVFAIDVFARRVVCRQVAASLYADLALDALGDGHLGGTGTAANLTGLVHHSDCGVQDRAIRCTQRLEEADAVASAG